MFRFQGQGSFGVHQIGTCQKTRKTWHFHVVHKHFQLINADFTVAAMMMARPMEKCEGVGGNEKNISRKKTWCSKYKTEHNKIIKSGWRYQKRKTRHPPTLYLSLNSYGTFQPRGPNLHRSMMEAWKKQREYNKYLNAWGWAEDSNHSSSNVKYEPIKDARMPG